MNSRWRLSWLTLRTVIAISWVNYKRFLRNKYTTVDWLHREYKRFLSNNYRTIDWLHRKYKRFLSNNYRTIDWLHRKYKRFLSNNYRTIDWLHRKYKRFLRSKRWTIAWDQMLCSDVAVLIVAHHGLFVFGMRGAWSAHRIARGTTGKTHDGIFDIRSCLSLTKLHL